MIEMRAIGRLLGRKTSLLTVLVLALGMGASVAFFSVAYTVLLHPVRVKDLNRLVVLTDAFTPPNNESRVSWWGQAPSLESLTAYRSGWGTLRWGGHSQTVMATLATPQFFRVFDSRPRLGRGFRASDQEPGAARVAVLSRRLWADGFRASRNVVGKEAVLDGTALQIIGVAPAGFQFPGRTDLWVAQQLRSGQAGGGLPILLGGNGRSDVPYVTYSMMVGRPKPGATISGLDGDLSMLLHRMQREFGQEAAREKMVLSGPVLAYSFRKRISGTSKSEVILLFGGSLFLLLVACLNGGNLLLAQSMARERETAIRRCLGATPGRVVRKMLGESMVLALAGAGLGMLLAWWGVALLRRAGSAQIAGLANTRVMPLAVGFAVLLVILAGLMSGIAPALDARRVEPGQWLGGEGHALTPRLAPHMRKVFAAGQIALAFVLIAGAAVTAKSLYSLLQTSPGFDPNGVVAVSLVSMPTGKQRAGSPGTARASRAGVSSKSETGTGSRSAAQREAILRHERMAAMVAAEVVRNRELVGRLRRIAKVSDVGLTRDLPFGENGGGIEYLDANGKLAVAGGQVLTVGGDYFRTLKIPLLAGRCFAAGGDNRGTVIVDRSLARDIWGKGNPVGRSLRVEGENKFRRVIGVVGDVKFSSLAPASWKYGDSQFYLPMDDPYGGRFSPAMAVVVRTSGEPKNLLPELDQAIGSVEPGAAVYGAATMNEMIGESVGGLRFRGGLLAFFALAAMVLGLLGVYGVTSFAASRRTREFALRMALGARPGEVVLLAARETAIFIPAGIAAGVGLALGVSKLLLKFLPGVKAAGPGTLVATAAALAVMAVAAALVPALRVSRTHPSEALRYE